MPIKAPYGTWKSPISADILTEKSISISDVLVDPVTGVIYHTEDRPFEEGRTVLVGSKKGKDILPAGWSASSGVHEYGGSCTAVFDGVFYFSDGKTGRIARIKSSGEPEFVTPENSNYRFVDLAVHPKHPHLLVAVLEDHTNPKPADVVNKLVTISTTTSTISVLAEGADFYSFPTFTPDGKRIAYIQWFHPNMPWEATQLYVADIDVSAKGISRRGAPKHIAGEGEQSISQPLWTSNDTLVFTTDVSGFSNPWVWDATKDSSRAILPEPMLADFEEPAWQFGDYHLVALNETQVLVTPLIDSKPAFGILDIPSGKISSIPTPYVWVSRIRRVSPTGVVFIGVQDTVASSLVLFTFNPNPTSNVFETTFETLKTTSDLSSRFPATLITSEKSIALPNPDAAHPLHVLLALPRNPEYDPAGNGSEKPPCVVMSHGGPTSRTPPGLAWMTQFFTTRGWAFCSVNYSGSSGFGREYRERLKGQWGVVDVADCVTAVKLLGEQGLIDPKRVAIRGRSAGGYAVLQALVDYPDVWAAGASSYGISDLVALAGDTHKFESQYAYKLLGGTMEEVPEVYHDRSPVNFAEKITAPTLILQGSIDKVVPPNQAEMIVEKIKSKGGKVKYIVFEGEGHGWKKSEHVKRATEEELAWYEEVFGLGPEK